MTTPQIIVFAVLAATLVLFIWNRWRYDIVAIAALLAVAIAGIVPADDAFSGFGHPAVITVAAVLVISQGLLNAGALDIMTRYLSRIGRRPTIQVAALTGFVVICSGFMNNIAALAMLMPIAIWMSRRNGLSPSIVLMPLAFGSLLGGTMTLIGTPPNIIIAAYREQAGKGSFGLFDFFPVGAGVALVGLAFISLIGWRFMPERKGQAAPEDLFEIDDYISEVRVPKGSKYAGQTLHDLVSVVSDQEDVTVIGLLRGEHRQMIPSPYRIVHEGDILIVETDSDSLKTLIDEAELELVESKEDSGGKIEIESENIGVVEAVAIPGASLIGRSASSLNLRERYGVNVIAVARQGRRLQERLGQIRFLVADILLLQGDKERLQEAVVELGCLPLAERGLRIGKPRKILLALGLFGAAIAAIMFGVLQPEVALVSAALAMMLFKILTPGEAYRKIDWPVIVLLAAMIPVGQSLETTGGAQLIADQLVKVSESLSPAMTLAVMMLVTMALSNVVNNAAAAILMAPVAIALARGMEASADPMLMTVAIGASCVFLTPIAHQSNALVMAPGGYKFSDYSRMGIPLTALTVLTAVPLIMRVWPLWPAGQ